MQTAFRRFAARTAEIVGSPYAFISAVFLIQNTQNRDTKSLHLKIDELLKATTDARNCMIDLDALSDEQLKQLEAEFKRLCEQER